MTTSSFAYLTIHDQVKSRSSDIRWILQLFQIGILLPCHGSFSIASTDKVRFQGDEIPTEIPTHAFHR